MTRKGKWWTAIVIVVGVLVGVFYYGFVDRVEERFEKAGWLVIHSHLRWACPVCTGQVERLECNGRTIAVPAPPGKRSLRMISPVGSFHLWSGGDRWFREASCQRSVDGADAISGEDLSRGYYELANIYAGVQGGAARKAGTPEQWCLIMYTDELRGWWIAPELIGQAPWAQDSGVHQSAPAATTCPDLVATQPAG